ncbi:MAG: CPBP family intramembrane metalloprotease [Opitutae bacterium]|nr:CPBP family intramembrane metalloprotease [Opitutae bacterium]
MPDPSFDLGPKQAAGLTGKFVLYQVGLGVGIAGGSALVGAVLHLQGFAKTVTESPWALVVINTTAAALVLRVQLRRSHATWGQLATWGANWVSLLPFVVLLVLGEGILLSEFDNRVSVILPRPDWVVEFSLRLVDLARHPIGAPFALVVMAAVTEEFLFRGLILRGLLARFTPRRAIVVSAALFALMHMNPWQMPGAFLGGVVLGWVYFRTRSLALCICGHGFHNALSLFVPSLPFVIDGFNRPLAPGQILFQPWWLDLLGLVLVGGGAFLFNRQAPVAAPAPSPPAA